MSLVVPEHDHCAFCDHLEGRGPLVQVERSAKVALIVTREQRGIAHVLAVPVVHRPTIVDLADDELAPLLDLTRRAAAAIEAAYGVEGVAVWQNNGVSAYQTVPHVHVHVAGTRAGAPTEWGDVPRLSREDTAVIADRLRSHLRPPPAPR